MTLRLVPDVEVIADPPVFLTADGVRELLDLDESFELGSMLDAGYTGPPGFHGPDGQLVFRRQAVEAWARRT